MESLHEENGKVRCQAKESGATMEEIHGSVNELDELLAKRCG
jgi:hypothetical protein